MTGKQKIEWLEDLILDMESQGMNCDKQRETLQDWYYAFKIDKPLNHYT